jgi:hypothetical protein
VGDILSAEELVGLLFVGQPSPDTDIARLSLDIDAEDQGPLRAAFGFDTTGIGALDGLGLGGFVSAELRPDAHIVFGIDGNGFFLDPNTTIGGTVAGSATASGSLGPFSLAATGTIEVEPTVSFAPIGGKVRPVDVSTSLANLEVALGSVAAELKVNLSSDLLDYVDADADGDATNNTATEAIRSASWRPLLWRRLRVGTVSGSGVFTPLNGNIIVGATGLGFGPVIVDANLTLGRFDGGLFRNDTVGASATVTAGDTAVTAGGTLTVVDTAGGGRRLDVDVAAALSFVADLGPGARLDVDAFGATFELTLALTADFALVSSSGQATLTGITIGRVEAEFGPADDPLLQFVAQPSTPGGSAATFQFTDPDAPLMTFGTLSASLPALTDLPGFNALTGSVSNFAVDFDAAGGFVFTPLPGFEVVFTNLPTAEAFGLPDFFPISVTGLGLAIGPRALAGTDASDLVFILSAGVATPGADDLPIPIPAGTLEVHRLRINIGRLAGGDPIGAIEGLGGFFFGIEPIEIAGALTVGGGLGLGLARDPATGKQAFYARIQGHFELADIGGGIDLVLTEFGPLLATIGVPLGIPLGPTGILLSDARGGFCFGGPAFPTVTGTTPEEIVESLLGSGDPRENPDNPANQSAQRDLLDLTQADIDAAVMQLLRENEGADPTFLLSQSITLALTGELTTVATPGILTGDVTLAVQVQPVAGGIPVVKFMGSGTVQAAGIEMAAWRRCWTSRIPSRPSTIWPSRCPPRATRWPSCSRQAVGSPCTSAPRAWCRPRWSGYRRSSARRSTARSGSSPIASPRTCTAIGPGPWRACSWPARGRSP